MDNVTLKIIGGNIILAAPEPQIICLVIVKYENFTIRAKGDNMAYTLPADHEVTVQVTYTDAAGNPATVDNIAWASDPPSIINALVDPTDGSILTITPVGPAGNAQVTATADVDLGEGVKPLVTTMDVTIVAGEAVAGTIAPTGPAVPITP